MRVVAVVQARLSSSRLPAKILLDLGGVTALERCLRRVSRFRGVAEVAVATSAESADDVVASVVGRLGYTCVRGSETDVLSRFALAADKLSADAVVRCTSDCPLLDPEISSEVIETFLRTKADYASNVLDRKLPRGLDTEIMTRAALDAAHHKATQKEEREHVTLHIYRRPETYRCVSVTNQGPDLSSNRWTLDTLDDYRFLYATFERLGAVADTAGMANVLAIIGSVPELKLINAHVQQKLP